MRINKQRPEKRKSFSIFTGLIALILILSFFSITNVYAIDDEIFSGHSDTYQDDSLKPVPDESVNIEIHDGDSKNPPIEHGLKNKNEFRNENSNNQNSDVSYSEKGNNLEKTDGKATTIDKTDSTGFYFNIDFYNSNSKGNFNDIKDYVNQDIVLLISSNSQGNSLENNNFIKKVANINFNKIDNDEDFLPIPKLQSISFSTLTILFFMKIFMDFHNHGKERLNSF
jgi:hypothetical protein